MSLCGYVSVYRHYADLNESIQKKSFADPFSFISDTLCKSAGSIDKNFSLDTRFLPSGEPCKEIF